MGHGKGHFGPFPPQTPSSFHFPCQPLSNTLFFRHFPPLQRPIQKKLTFRHRHPHLGPPSPICGPTRPPLQRRLQQNPICRHPFAPFMGLFASPFKDPYKNFYFLTPHTFPLQRPLQITLFFKLFYDEESVFFLQGCWL